MASAARRVMSPCQREITPSLTGISTGVTIPFSSARWRRYASWISNVSGAYTGVVTTASAQYFIKGEYEVGGETYIRNAAPISVDGGLYATNTASGGYVKIRAKYNGSTITWEVVP